MTAEHPRLSLGDASRDLLETQYKVEYGLWRFVSIRMEGHQRSFAKGKARYAAVSASDFKGENSTLIMAEGSRTTARLISTKSQNTLLLRIEIPSLLFKNISRW